MKKYTALLLTFLLLLSLFAGCGSDEPPAATPTPEAAATPAPEPPKPEKPAEIGYWTLLRVDSEQADRVVSEEDIETFKSLGLEIFLDLKEDGSGGIMMDEFATLKWGNGEFLIDAEDIKMEYAIEGEELLMEFEGDTYVFVRGEGEAPKVEPSAGDAEDAETDPLYWWDGDWYGWWIVDSGYGSYEERTEYFWDAYASIIVNDDGTGWLDVWDLNTDYWEPLMSAEVYFGDGATEKGALWAESGYFMDEELEHADFCADPGAMGFEIDNMISISYKYEDPFDENSGMYISIYLRPWGTEWDDVEGETDESWPYDDMMPLYYHEWYMPLVEKGYDMPLSYEDGYYLLYDVSVAPEGDALASGLWDDYRVDIMGAEHFVDLEGHDAIRIYYDFTNLSDETVYANEFLMFEVLQDDYEQVVTSADWGEEVEEVDNGILYIRPGVTIRCVEEYSMKRSGGEIVLKISDYWDETASMTYAFDPADLPGPPADWEEEYIVSHPWLEDIPAEGVVNESYVVIDHVDIVEDYEENEAFRIFVNFRNNSAESTSFGWALGYRAFQNGIELESTWPAHSQETEADDMLYEDIAPGESTMAAVCYLLRNEQSPVEFEIYDSWTGEVVGHIFELTWGG